MTPRIGPGRPFFAGCGIACLLLAVAFVGAFSRARYLREHRYERVFKQLRIGMTKAEVEKVAGQTNVYPTSTRTSPPSVFGIPISIGKRETLRYVNYGPGPGDALLVDLVAEKAVKIEYYADERDRDREGKPTARKP